MPPELKLIWNNVKAGENMNQISTLDVFSIVSITLVSDKDKPLSIKANLS